MADAQTAPTTPVAAPAPSFLSTFYKDIALPLAQKKLDLNQSKEDANTTKDKNVNAYQDIQQKNYKAPILSSINPLYVGLAVAGVVVLAVVLKSK